MKMKRCAVLLLALAWLLLATAGSAMALDLTLNAASASWASVSGGPDNIIGLNTEEVRWGTPADTQQAGLRFDAVGTPTSISTDAAFSLGILTHFNFPTTGNPATGAALALDLTVTDGGIFNEIFNFDFAIDETPNAEPCPDWQVSGTPCDDRITFPSAQSSEMFTIDGIDYTLLLLGFGPTADSLQDSFITEEGLASRATLWGELDSTGGPGDVPEPAALLLIGTGLLGLAGFRRKFSK